MILFDSVVGHGQACSRPSDTVSDRTQKKDGATRNSLHGNRLTLPRILGLPQGTAV